MIWLVDAAGLPEAGGKAELLGRARRAGLPVPDGFVVLPDEELDEKELSARLASLGAARFAVRSSADLEDRPRLSAAGVFESVIGVEAEEVPRAVARVRDSARAEPARAYLSARGYVPRRVRMAVLVQPLAPGRKGVLHTAPLDEGTLLAEEREGGEPEWGEVAQRRVRADEPLALGAMAMARLVGGAADVEYALGEAGPVFLQARPLSAPAVVRDPRRFRLEGPDARASFRRDAEHNPEPLSAAQASLVDLLDGVPSLPRQRVLHGYLFVADEAGEPAGDAIPPALLPSRFADEIEPACDALLRPLEAGGADPGGLEAAIDVYLAVLRRYLAEVTPSLRAARRALDALLQRSIGEPLARHGALLGGTGGRTRARDAALREIGLCESEAERRRRLDEYLRGFGFFTPAWDVAVAPDDEAETRVLAAATLLSRGPSPEARHREALELAEAAARRVADRMSPPDRDALASLLPAVRAALTVAEDDDALFFRAQRIVRRPLLAIGAREAKRGALDGAWQIFDLPIGDVRAGHIDPGRARANRAAREAARRLAPPSAIRRGVPTWRGAPTGAGVLEGTGTAGRAWGRAFVLDGIGLEHEPPVRLPSGAVLVAQAILPSHTYLIPSAAALVTDHGGALSHAATLAREYGVPAVLGTGFATRLLRGGEELLVDADAGRVYRLGGG